MVVTWSYPTRILFGAGCAAQLGSEVARLSASRVLIVSDEAVAAAGVLKAPLSSLDAAGIASAVFSQLTSNPTEAQVDEGAAAYRDFGGQALLSIGGGAAMDVAKLIAVRVRTPRPFDELDDAKGGDQWIPGDLPKTIAVPTTAGTGSEVGRAAVLTVASTGLKTIVFHPAMLPAAAVLDPELTVSLPPGATAATGFDALSHCLEAYLAAGDHPMADGIALSGLELVGKHLVTAVRNGKNLESRGAMLKAATMGAAAFQKGLGACHSLSHPLSAQLGLHHGLANALCLPAVVDFNEEVVPERVARASQALGGSGRRGECGQLLRALRRQCGLPEGLASQGLDEGRISALALLAAQDGCHAQNPRSCTAADFEQLYRLSL